jgi:hypothetical protein
MGKAYSQDLRERVMAAVECGNGRLCRGVVLPGQRLLYLQSFGAAAENGRDERASLGRWPQTEARRA